MRFDLAPLVVIQAAARNRKKTDLFGRQVGTLRPARITVGLVRDFVQHLKITGRKERRLVGSGDKLRIAIEFAQQAARLFVEQAQPLFGFLTGKREQRFHFLLRDACFDIAANVVKPVKHAHELQRIEFFRFDQNFFTHADFAEVMQQRCVAQLLHLFPGKAQLAVRSARLAIDRLRQRHCHFTHPVGMAGRRGVALFDGLHRGVHESIEEVFDVPIQPRVFVSHRRLRGERKSQPHRSLRKGMNQAAHAGRIR